MLVASRLFTCVAAVAMGLCSAQSESDAAKTLLIDDFRTVDAWGVNQDGGLVDISHGSAASTSARASMRLKFTLGKSDWGNAARRITIPANATSIDFDLLVHRAEAGAYLSVWLFEADGDGYLAFASINGKRLHDAGKGWNRVRVPIASFRYEPRGNKKREPLTVNKMLIGLGSGSAEVSIANLEFTTTGRESKMTLSSTRDLEMIDGPRGRVAILDDRFPERPGNADPKVLAAALTRAGYGVTFVKAGDLADPSVLTSRSFDCLILPYGPSYPYAAFDSVKAYLKSGGCFVSMGGYVFDEPCTPADTGALMPIGQAVTAKDLADDRQGTRNLNARLGNYGDTLGLDPDQIGAFDPGYILPEVHRLVWASQEIVPSTFSALVTCGGYAACAMLGSNSPVFPEKWGRLLPVVEGRDSLGRNVGPVGSIAYNYAGPYAGSAWAFFGVTNTDLFAENGPMLPHLASLVHAVTRRVFLHSLATDYACYTKNETIKITCKVANLGRTPHSARVIFSVEDRGGRKSKPIPGVVEASLKPGETTTVETQLPARVLRDDLARVTASLSIGGNTVDTIETGLVVYDPALTASGLPFNYKDNYFRAGERPVLFSGTNVTGAIFYSQNENPLVWDRDLARMNESGLNILRVLHFSPFLSDKPSPVAVRPIDLAVDRMPIKIERQFDALMQLCQKHRIALFLSVHDWMGQALSDEELTAQRKFARLIAARYKDAPGFMIDIQNEPNVELPREPGKYPAQDVQKAWNDHLRTKYKTDDTLKAAWTKSPPEASLGKIDYRAGTDAWDDMRTFDADCFRNVLIDRWIDANLSGARDGDPGVPVTVGFLQEYWSLNKLMSVERLDFANMHSYNPIEVLRADLKLFDRRFQGKSISLGEFGSLVDHDKRNRGEDNSAQDCNRFLLTGHYVFGLGGSFIANWCWKDMDDVIFPWGINYPCGGPRKDILKAYRNQSLLMRQVRPVYQPQQVFLVAPLNGMLGGGSAPVMRALYRYVNALMDARADFGVIDDQHLQLLPSSAKLLIYPVPMNVPDKAYGELRSFVERGGSLCMSGDVSYDELRRRTKTERLTDLCGVRFVSESYPNVAWESGQSPCISVHPAGAVQDGGVYVHRLGQGEVRFTPYAFGSADGSIAALYAKPLAQLGAQAVVQASAAHAFRIPETDGARTVVLVNPSDKAQSVSISEPGCDRVELALAANGVGMARFDRNGKLVAVESQGPVRIGNATLDGKGHFALISDDGQPLVSTAALIVLPFGGAEVGLSAFKGLARAVQEVGDVVDGGWKTLASPTGTRLKVTPVTAFDIHLVAQRSRMEQLRQRVVSELMLRRP